MLEDQVFSVPPQEQEPAFCAEVILLNQDTVIIDNLMALRYDRLNQSTPLGNKRKQKDLNIVIPKTQEAEAWRRGEHVNLSPNANAGNYQIMRFGLSRDDSNIIKTGIYTINSTLVLTTQGSGVLLKIESPNPIAKAIIEGFTSKMIAQGLTFQNR